MDKLTNELRFVNRDGRMVLQQKWKTEKEGMVASIYGGGTERGWMTSTEWRDIPIAVEQAKDMKENVEEISIDDEPETLDDVVESIADMCGIYGEPRFDFVHEVRTRINNAVCNGLARAAFDRMMEKIKDE